MVVSIEGNKINYQIAGVLSTHTELAVEVQIKSYGYLENVILPLCFPGPRHVFGTVKDYNGYQWFGEIGISQDRTRIAITNSASSYQPATFQMLITRVAVR